MGILKPTIFPAVPRLLNKVYDRAMAGARAAGGIKEVLFNQAVASKLYDLKQVIYLQHQYAFWCIVLTLHCLNTNRVLFVTIQYGINWYSRRFKHYWVVVYDS
jgi:long-subunit acyl-CoA synthetase (AMP-forming)